LKQLAAVFRGPMVGLAVGLGDDPLYASPNLCPVNVDHTIPSPDDCSIRLV
jgi:hypothetical protein